MVVVAYVAILYGMGVSTAQARKCRSTVSGKSSRADTMVKIYQDLQKKSADDAKLPRTNIAGLRAGKIPEGLQKGQREFLQSLDEDAKVTPEYRKYRRELITDGEESARIRQEHNVLVFQQSEEYYAHLAAKYEPGPTATMDSVEPDPPARNEFPWALEKAARSSIIRLSSLSAPADGASLRRRRGCGVN